jgi:hypothetical protein
MDALQISQAVSPMPELRNDVILPITPISMTDKMNWEGSPGIRVNRIQEGKLPSQKVECGTQVVSHFADYDAPLLGKFGRACLHYNGIVASLLIEFGSSNDTGILPEESFRIFLQGYELGFCPLDLSSCAIEWVHTLFHNTLAHVYSLYTMNFIMLVSLSKYQSQGVKQMTDNHIVTVKWVDAKFCPGIHREDNILEHNMSEFESSGYLISKPKPTTVIAAERNNVAGDHSSSLGTPLVCATLGCY